MSYFEYIMRIGEKHHDVSKKTNIMQEALELDQLDKQLHSKLLLFIRQQRNEIYLESNGNFRF